MRIAVVLGSLAIMLSAPLVWPDRGVMGGLEEREGNSNLGLDLEPGDQGPLVSDLPRIDSSGEKVVDPPSRAGGTKATLVSVACSSDDCVVQEGLALTLVGRGR